MVHELPTPPSPQNGDAAPSYCLEQAAPMAACTNTEPYGSSFNGRRR
jgi:hypothetical protein